MAAGRRQFIVGLGAAAAGAGIAAPALADPTPDVQWKLTSSFPTSLDLIYGGAETLAAAVSDMTDGHFTIKLSPAGEIAPALEALDAVADGRADCAHTALSYYWNKDPSFVFASSTPFGMNARQHAAWLQEGGGGALIDDFLAERKVFALPAGNTGGQMAGWFRKEIRTPADFNGLKLRIGGFAGKVFQTLGAEPVATPKDGIYAALESGALDGFEWVGPYDDERFGDQAPTARGSRFRKSRRTTITPAGGRAACSCISPSPRTSSTRCRNPIRRRCAPRRRRPTLRCWPNTTPPIPAR